MQKIVALRPGDRPDRGSIVVLCRGAFDARRVIEWWTSDGDWICPKTVNGYWYGRYV